VFCSIVAGSLPAHRIYEDQDTLAFLDIHPAAAGHTLVVPKTHATDLFTIAPETAAAVMRSATRVARLLDDVLTPDGLTVIQTNRAAGWQDVFHLHMHLVPRWDTDTLVRPWNPRQPRVPTWRPLPRNCRPGVSRPSRTPHRNQEQPAGLGRDIHPRSNRICRTGTLGGWKGGSSGGG
jgi:histidine triad (HIT) family protein